MTTAAQMQADGSTAKAKTKTLSIGESEERLGIAPFGTSLMERISTVFAGLGLSVAFGLTGTILAMAMRT